LNFLVDAQLPPALARALSTLGHESIHVEDLGLASAPDIRIWKEAVERGSVIITKDEDFIDGNRVRFGTPVPSVIWIRLGNISRRALLDSFLPLLPQIIDLIAAGDTVIEVRT
jgi:predicted nuclease of predicted toxin-antitoxin system